MTTLPSFIYFLVLVASPKQTPDLNPSTSISDLTNERTFEVVFKNYYSQLCAFAYQYLNDHDQAEEIVQEVFSNVWQKSSDIEIKTSVNSYLYGAVRNACLNYIKHQSIVRKHEAYEKQRSDFLSIDFLELDELQEEIDKALNKLPEKCREIFEMSRFEEKKYREIADELGISIKTVETQMARALKVMRATLEPYMPAILLWILWWQKKL